MSLGWIMLDIEAIKKRAIKATDGPWGIESCGEKGDGANMIGVLYDEHDIDCIRPMSGWVPDCRPVTGEFIEYYRDELVAQCDHRNRNASHDADFIAHARTDIPSLIAEVERQQAEIERLREALAGVLPYMEAAETAGLVGDEGCHWPVEMVRHALTPPEIKS